MPALEPSPRRSTRPLPASDVVDRARMPGVIAPTVATPTSRKRFLWAWIAIPAVLACLLAALTMTMVEPGAGQGLGTIVAPSKTPTSLPVVAATAPLSATVMAAAPPSATIMAAAPTDTAAVVAELPTVTDVPPTAVPTDVPTDTPLPLPTVTLLPPTDTPAPTEAPADTPEPQATATPAPQVDNPGPGQGFDPITGLVVDQNRVQRKPVVVMIDNHPDASPQTGLNRAAMVIEALAEGGITRFETFFTTGDGGTVGPVRSARPYFVEWAYPFQPFIVHCGGSWEAIDLIKEAQQLRNVDCFDSAQPFWRADDRLMPHNLYASTTELWKTGAQLGLTAPAGEPIFAHTAMLPRDQRPAEATLDFSFTKLSRSDVNWSYDPDSGLYLRSQWGYRHQDAATGETISAANVVVLWTNVWNLPNDNEGRLGTDTVGQNTALIMRDGQFEWGYWKRDSVTAPLQLLNARMEPMALAPGRLWIEVLGIGKQVQIAPTPPQ